jgi:hypothetical protein
LETCLNQTLDDYEIVINDNSDDLETKKYIQNLRDTSVRARTLIRYFKNDMPVAISANFELAVARARGDYFVVLGDDDGILPHCLREVQLLIEKTGMKVIKWANALYIWPSVAVYGGSDYLGCSLLRDYSIENGVTAILESLKTLEYLNLPMLYINAAVSREVVEQIRGVSGRIFGSRCADVYSGFAVAYFSPEYVSSTVPLTVAGVSRASTGVSHLFAGGNAAPVVDFNTLNAQQGVVRHPKVPDLPIYPTQVTAESFLHAKDQLFPNDDRLVLPRMRIFEQMLGRADLSDAATRQEFQTCAADDTELQAVVEDFLHRELPRPEKPRLRPELLGADGVNLHLDASDFGIDNVAGAVAFLDKLIWPANAPLRYDLGNYRELLIERTEQSAMLSSELIDRMRRLEAALHDLAIRSRELSDENARISMFEDRFIKQ